MREDIPAWYEAARQNRDKETYFTEDMKRSVIHRIEQKRPRAWMNSAFRASAILLAGLSAIVLMISVLDRTDRLPGMNSSSERMAAGAQGESVKLDYSYSTHLAFGGGKVGERHYRLEALPISSVVVKEEVHFSGIGSYYSYTKSVDDPQLYFGIMLDELAVSGQDVFFEIGPGSMMNVQMDRSGAFGESLTRLAGGCGPKLDCTSWFAIEDGAPVYVFFLDTAAYEADLNGDGMDEVIAVTYPTHSRRTYIYKKTEDGIAFVEVKPALGIEPRHSVSFDPYSKWFQVKTDDGISFYRYADDEDALVRIRAEE